MKKILFLLVALLSVVGVNAQVSFTADPTELGVDNSGNVTTATFTVKNGDVAAEAVGADAYVYDGVAKLTNPVTINSLGNGKFTATITDVLPLGKQLLLVFPEGFFKANGQTSKRLTIYLPVYEKATFKAVPVEQSTIAVDKETITFYVEQGCKTPLVVEVSATGVAANSSVYTDAGITLPETVKTNGTKATIDPTTIATTVGVHKVVIPAGAFRTKYTTGPEITVNIDVKEPVEFSINPVAINNKDTKFTFTFNAPVPGLENAWKQADAKVTSIALNGKTYTNITKAGDVYTVDMGADDLKDLAGAASKTFDVVLNGDFRKANSVRTTAKGQLVVNQLRKPGVVISGETQTVSNLYTVVENVSIAYPAGVTGKAFKVTLVTGDDWTKKARITDGLTFNTAVKELTPNAGKYNVTFEKNLELGNEYLLVFPVQTVEGMGDDYVVYYSAEQTIHITVKKDFKFYDKIVVPGLNENKPITTTAAEVSAAADDNFNSVVYTRNFTGKRESWYVPFDLTLTDELLENYTFQKITAITLDEDVYNIHYQTIKKGQKLYANKPYLVTAKSAGQKSITLEKNKPFVNPSMDLVECATTQVWFNIIGLPEAYNMAGLNNVYAIGASGVISAVGDNRIVNGVSAPVTVSAWRWVLEAINYLDDYAKFGFVDDAETTGINNVNVVEDGAIYNVAGQRVSAPVKGQVYVKNGKKFIAE